jgi:hypothetical protein
LEREKLNNLVHEYKHGNELALDGIYKEVSPILERASREMERLMEDFASFDCVVLRELERHVKTFDVNKHDFLSAVKAVVSKYKARYIRRNKEFQESYVSMNAMEESSSVGADEDSLGWQFEAKENVEDEILFKEKIALLAQGDSFKETILLEWSKGANDTSISELLAQRFGGKSESHRRSITRFKTECQKRLANV